MDHSQFKDLELHLINIENLLLKVIELLSEEEEENIEFKNKKD